MCFVEVSNNELMMINGGGTFAAVAVVVVGVAVTCAALATFPPAAPLVGKVVFTVGSAIATGASAYAAYKS